MNNYFSRIVLIFLSVFMSYSLYAQSIKLHQLTTSISYNTLLERNEFVEISTNASGQTTRIESRKVWSQQKWGGTLGYRISKPNLWFYELGIRQLGVHEYERSITEEIPGQTIQPTSISGFYIKTFNFLSRFEVGKFLIENSKWNVSVALGLSPFIFQSKFDPKITSSFPTILFDSGIWLGLSPRITRRLNDRLALELQAHFAMIDVHYDSYRTDNPNLNLRQQKTTQWITDFGLINTQISLGLNVALNEPSEEEQGKKKKRKKRRRRRR